MTLRCFCAVVAALCMLVCVSAVRADAGRSRVALVRSESTDRLLRDASTRLRAELDAAGFEVIEVERAPGDPRAGVEDAQGGSAFAVVALSRARAGAFADIWISDHVSGKTVVRRLEVSEASNAATVLAIRALELLRASLLEVAAPLLASEPAATEAPRDVLAWVGPIVAPEEAPAPRDPFAHAALDVSALGLLGTRGLGPALGPSLRVSHGLGWRLFGRLALAVPLVGPEPDRAEGSAAVRQEFAAVDIGIVSEPRVLRAFAWIGAGAFHLHTAGSAPAGFRARSDDEYSFLSNAGVGGMLRLGPRTALTAELGAILLVPHPVVVIAKRDSGTAGMPSLSFALGVLIAL